MMSSRKGESNTYYVVGIEGIHGVGKSTIIKKLKEQGFPIMEEVFLNETTKEINEVNDSIKSENNNVDNSEEWEDKHSFFFEMKWICKWFDRILNQVTKFREQEKEEEEKGKEKDYEDYEDSIMKRIIFSDRSYLTGLIYGKMSDLTRIYFHQICKSLINTFFVDFNIKILILYMNPPSMDKLLHRIKVRLEEDPRRKGLNENNVDFINSLMKMYRQFRKEFFAEITLGVDDNLDYNLKDVLLFSHDDFLPIPLERIFFISHHHPDEGDSSWWY